VDVEANPASDLMVLDTVPRPSHLRGCVEANRRSTSIHPRALRVTIRIDVLTLFPDAIATT